MFILQFFVIAVNIEYMSKLNKEQQIAINIVDGPILILAGAGSGKTRVLTEKIAHLISNKHAEPEEILALTFTNKAADEMKSRVSKILGENPDIPKWSSSRIWMGTFHSICLKIIRANSTILGLNPHFSIYDADDQIDAVKEALKKLGLADKKINPRAIHSFISSAKNELIDSEAYKKYAEGYFQSIVADAYPLYQKVLVENSAIDFDDILLLTVKLFKDFPEVLARYQKMFKFILIDEYQDTNHAQYLITKMLADAHKNICVVGDDAQSIYGFRGATIKNILDFEKDYPNAKVIKLEQNYRSTQTILDASNEIILRNKNQKRKEMWTENPRGEKFLVYEARNEKDEANWIALKIKDLIARGVNPSEIVVLYRTNAQSRALEEGLLQAGVNYKIVGGLRFYERREVRDIIAYLKVLYNHNDELSLKRIVNVPKRGIGPKKVEELKMYASGHNISVMNFLMSVDSDALKGMDKAVIEFAELIRRLYSVSTTASVPTLINEVFIATGYRQWLDDGSSENEFRIENIKELISVASKYSDLPPSEGLEAFLNEVGLLEEQSNLGDYELGAEESLSPVTLMTIHASKGLEFEYVFIAGMEEGLFPHSRSYAEPSEMEEERRLAYVATTRAKQKVIITYTESRTFFGTTTSNPISRFLTDIPNRLLEFENSHTYASDSIIDKKNNIDESIGLISEQIDLKPGDLVRHSTFGIGSVLDIDYPIISVNFNGKVKELSLEYVSLEKI